MTKSEDEKLARYEWLCKAFDDAYHEDGVDSNNPVKASLLACNANYRTVQFTINLQEHTDSKVDLDSFIKSFMDGKN